MGTIPKEGRTRREYDQETERNRERGQEIICKRLSSHTHDPSDRIQIYWFLAYTSERGKGKREIVREIEFGGPFGVNGSQGFYDLDSEATYASVSSFHGLLICLRSVNARIAV